MTPELIGQLAVLVGVLIAVAVIAGAMWGRRYGERQEHRRHTQNEILTAVNYLRADESRSADDLRERMQRMEGNVDRRLHRIGLIVERLPQAQQSAPPDAPVPVTDGRPAAQG